MQERGLSIHDPGRYVWEPPAFDGGSSQLRHKLDPPSQPVDEWMRDRYRFIRLGRDPIAGSISRVLARRVKGIRIWVWQITKSLALESRLAPRQRSCRPRKD
jgi:hypothetical protein